jgi:hypothetical protein
MLGFLETINMKLIVLYAILLTSKVYTDTYYDFNFRNNSIKSVPLLIPGVMNPNLSPMSTSGISLKDGQEVFFFHNKRKYILLTVSS